MKHLQRKSAYSRARGGFTLTEVLVVVAVLALLSAVAVTSLTVVRRNLRQKELDSKAELIYTAAQNRMAELRAAGCAGSYQYSADSENGVAELGYTPCDADDASDGVLCYVRSQEKTTAGAAAAAILPESAVDAELWGGSWRIEFDPASGSVYGVFYSPTDELPDDGLKIDALRVLSVRRRQGARVGYYGGDRVNTEDTNTLRPDITIENGEELTAYFYCNNPGSPLTFTITLSTGSKTYTRTVKSADIEAVNSQTYRYKWVLDSLKSDGTRFAAQTEHRLDNGAELTVKLTVTCSDPLIDQASASRRTNGLFYYTPGQAADTALIRSGRHLQNLDSASGVTAAITRAVQVSDLSFRDDAGDDTDWYTVYNDRAFTPITNPNLLSYDGHYTVEDTELYTTIHGLHVADCGSAPAGLFGTFSGSAIRNVTLTGARIDGGSRVGALAGETAGELTVENCRVYLSARHGDLDGITTVDAPADAAAWLTGKTVGGLIGATSTAKTTIKTSMAATILRAEDTAGGLIGTAGGPAELDTVYADCYLTAPTTGGLVGGGAGAPALKNFYAAGYQTATVAAGGLMPGTLSSAENGYSVCDLTLRNGARGFSTAAGCEGTLQNVYYLTRDDDSSAPLAGTRYTTYSELSGETFAAAHLSDAFTAQTGGASNPYNLMAQGLADYSYPRLAALNHYGDWRAEFESGTLVYYEVYRENGQDVYAFSGANAYTLRSDCVAVGDGYAIAFGHDPGEDLTVELTYAGGKTYTLTSERRIAAAAREQTYYLLPLPAEITDTDYLDASGTTAFYQQLTVDGKSYYYNPHFAESATAAETKPAAPETVNIRTARQLYALSRFYPNYAPTTTASAYRQWLDVDYTTYRWSEFTMHGDVSQQAPITSDAGFTATYDGGGHSVHGVSFRSQTERVGLFGTIAPRGIVQNVVLLGDGAKLIYAGRSGENIVSGSGRAIHMGALAGYNSGSIRNCAAAGYTVTFRTYNSSYLYLGGLIGTNDGTAAGSMADSASMQLTATSASAYAGGFAGANTGTITGSYALGRISVRDAKRSTVRVAGFAADNSGGALRRCYSGVALTAAGTSEIYGFARKGGAAVQCYYLDGGTYTYDGSLYAFNASTNAYASLAAGKPVRGEALQTLTLRDFSTADAAYDASGANMNENYPFPAVVTNAANQTAHYGSWPVQADIGTLGVFYWEYEAGGSNSGYHFSYVGTSQGTEISSEENDLLSSGNSLCREHDDGGAVTRYGYGYFYETDAAVLPEFSATDCVTGARVSAAEQELARQMPGYTFVAYQTGDLYLNADAQNSTWTLRYGTAAEYTYEVSPFFADSMALRAISLAGEAQDLTGAVRTEAPGTKDNPYQIRSAAQLQYINWNWAERTADYSISADNTTSANDRWTIRQYPYLIYTDENTPAPLSRGLYWEQSHDVDSYLENGNTVRNFTPIGSLYDIAKSLDSAVSNPYTAFFAESYDGQSYAIKNIEIHSAMQCIGLFGITAGAKLQNIVLYSERGSVIENEPGGKNWYCVGGLVGFAASRSEDAKASITNCTVSGYTIYDHRGKGYSLSVANNDHQTGWGGGCVGGLVGATNMNISGCTAVNDIIIDIGYNYNWLNLRVGGIAGACRASIDSCYAGGSIVSTTPFAHQGYGNSTSIWVGGITGGIVLRTDGTIKQILGEVENPLVVTNCYCFVDVPRRGSNLVASSQSIASNGEMQQTFTTIKKSAAELRNCYALRATAENADDYREYQNKQNWSGGQNLNVLDRWSGDRQIMLYNETTPYLTYSEMGDEMLSKLTANGGVFDTVTVRESGVAIDGKYTHPGNDRALDGMNYPFPTVLTQEDLVFGGTVNVHYGAWPKPDLYWEQTSAALDLLDVDEESGEARLDVRLYLTGIGGGEKPAITILTEDGEELTGAGAASVAEISAFDADGGYFTVTFTGSTPGDVLVEASLGESTARLRLSVTADLLLTASPEAPELYVGEQTELTLTVRHSSGAALPEAAAKRLQWGIQLDHGGAEQDVVECRTSDIVYDADRGVFTLPLTGFSAGEASIAITCLYPHTGADGQILSITQKVNLSATVYPNDVLGVTDGVSNRQIRLPYTVPDGTTGYLDRDAADGPAVAGLYLYATRAYTDLSDFTLASATITRGGAALTVGEDGFTEGREYRLRLAGEVLDAGDYDLRALTLETAQTDPVTLRLELERSGVRYTFELNVMPTETQYAVEFADERGNVLFTKYAPYSGTVTLTEDETGARRWDIPDAIYEPLTLQALPADTADDVPDDTDAPEDEPDEEL